MCNNKYIFISLLVYLKLYLFKNSKMYYWFDFPFRRVLNYKYKCGCMPAFVIMYLITQPVFIKCVWDPHPCWPPRTPSPPSFDHKVCEISSNYFHPWIACACVRARTRACLSMCEFKVFGWQKFKKKKKRIKKWPRQIKEIWKVSAGINPPFGHPRPVNLSWGCIFLCVNFSFLIIRL